MPGRKAKDRFDLFTKDEPIAWLPKGWIAATGFGWSGSITWTRETMARRTSNHVESLPRAWQAGGARSSARSPWLGLIGFDTSD
jgi:hypothetical protein